MASSSSSSNFTTLCPRSNADSRAAVVLAKPVAPLYGSHLPPVYCPDWDVARWFLAFPLPRPSPTRSQLPLLKIEAVTCSALHKANRHAAFCNRFFYQKTQAAQRSSHQIVIAQCKKSITAGFSEGRKDRNRLFEIAALYNSVVRWANT